MEILYRLATNITLHNIFVFIIQVPVLDYFFKLIKYQFIECIMKNDFHTYLHRYIKIISFLLLFFCLFDYQKKT